MAVLIDASLCLVNAGLRYCIAGSRVLSWAFLHFHSSFFQAYTHRLHVSCCFTLVVFSLPDYVPPPFLATDFTEA